MESPSHRPAAANEPRNLVILDDPWVRLSEIKWIRLSEIKYDSAGKIKRDYVGKIK